MCLALALTGTAVSSVGAATTSTTIAVSADAYVDSTRPSNNFGSRGTLHTDGSPLKSLLLKFSVPAIADPVTRATLRVYVSSSSSAGLAAQANAPTWAESTVTWSNAPAAGAALGSVPKAASGTWAAFDVTKGVTPGTEVGFRVSTPGSTQIAAAGREAGASTAAQLVIETGTTGAPATSSSPPATSSSPATTSSPPATSSSPPPAGTTDPVVGAVGDIACDPTSGSFNGGLGTANNCRQKAVADVISAMPGLSAVLPLGDVQYENGSLTNFRASYDLSWGRFNPIVRPVSGNHEYLTAGAAGYYGYFGATAGDPAKGYYSYDLGAWHVVAINSNCAEVGGCGSSSAQMAWLKADLAAHPTKCTLAYWHHPLFSSGQHGNNAAMAPMWDALVASGAELVLSGHDHDYERFAPQTSAGVASAGGMRQFVVGSGGKNHYGLTTVQPNSEVTNVDTYGALQLTLSPSSYSWKFVPEAGKTFTDSGTTACR